MPSEASLLALSCMLLSFLRGNSAFVFRLSPRRHFHLIDHKSSLWTKPSSSATARTVEMNSNKNNIALEIEQKFALDNGGSVEERLKELGLQEKGCITMVDWYFDLPAPHWVLAPEDYWLRCRLTDQKCAWELKRGGRHEGGSTLYEEIEGVDGINVAVSMIPLSFSAKNNSDEVPKRFDGFPVPELPVPSALVPFARIETRRSTWAFHETTEGSSQFNGLTVDLDGTNFGHMVGEVEAVVYNKKDIPVAREKIAKLIAEITTNGSAIGVGKLEYYLMNNEPDLYEACVKSGVISKK